MFYDYILMAIQKEEREYVGKKLPTYYLHSITI